MSYPSFELRALTFTGLGQEPIGIDFAAGLNILYGGSNAGKSYVLKTLNFMLGSRDPLTVLDQGRPYDQVFLTLDLPDGRTVTLRRAVKGGNLVLYNAAVFDGNVAHLEGQVLIAKHGAGNGNNLSEFLLNQIGIDGASIVEKETGKKAPLSFRNLVPYLLVPEGAMLGDVSPISSTRGSLGTFEKNVFRFVLTGQDDSSIVAIPGAESLKAANTGKVELLDEMIAQMDADLESYPDSAALSDQLERLMNFTSGLLTRLQDTQSELDRQVTSRRALQEEWSSCVARASEIRTMLARFRELDAVYSSDIQRLMALEEGGYILRRFADRPCPLCGAAPGHQHAPHGTVDIDRQQRAAAAEIAKIRLEQTELHDTMHVLEAEEATLENRVLELDDELSRLAHTIEELRPREASARKDYEQAAGIERHLRNGLRLLDQRLELLRKREEIASKKIGRQRAEGLTIGIDGPTAFEFTQTVKKVLDAWHFPNVAAVTFDERNQDIAVNGRARRDNGKGVRAILHSAFKVAVLLYCREKELPHPGVLVLDSPMVTYREPIRYERLGNLTDDEHRMRATDLNVHFYRHLASLEDKAQVIVIENQDPPESILPLAHVHVFSGENGDGRQGFFPPLTEDKK